MALLLNYLVLQKLHIRFFKFTFTNSDYITYKILISPKGKRHPTRIKMWKWDADAVRKKGLVFRLTTKLVVTWSKCC